MLRDLLHDLAFRLRALTNRGAAEREMADEMEFHLKRAAERLVREGLPVAEAQRRARLDFGGVERAKEEARDAWGTRLFVNASRDFAHAVRLMRRAPGFSSVVVLSLALSLGATLTVFNLTWNVLFATLALPHPEQMVAPLRWDKQGRDGMFRWDELEAMRAATSGVSFAAMRGASSIAVRAGQVRHFINLDFVEGSFFSVIGLSPRDGRLLSPQDDAESAPVVVVSEGFAERLFPSDPVVVGKTVEIRGATFTIVGVTPRAFRGVRYPGSFDAAIPIGSTTLIGSGGSGRDNRGIPYGRGNPRDAERPAFQLVGRLAGGIAAAQASVRAAFAACCASGPAGTRQQWVELVDIRRGIPGGKGDMRHEARTSLGLLLGGMLLVNVVVCCNIASLLLVRAVARQREIAVRLSLGASRVRLAWQLVIESVPQSALGTLAGFVFAAWFTRAFARELPGDWDHLRPMVEFRAHPVLVAVTAALGLACTLAFAVYPALRATSRPLASSLRIDPRASRTRRQGSVARGVAVTQVALTLVLVAAAGLLCATFVNVSRAESGVESDHMLLAGIGTRSTPYEARGVVPLAEDIVQAVAALPGVRAASIATLVPLYGGANYAAVIRVPGFEPAPGRETYARLVVARPGFFEVAGMRIVAGRGFAASEAPARPVVVSEAFAARYFKGREAVGAIFELESDGPRNLAPVRVVGVARDARYETLKDPPTPYVFVPMGARSGTWQTGQLVVRTAGAPLDLARDVLRAVEAVAPGIEVRRVRDMETQRAWATTSERLAARMAVFVSVMSLALSAIGLYGVVAYGVSRRTSEIGVRLALGARTGAILWLVSRETVLLVGSGIAIGAALAHGAAGAMQSQVFGIAPHDPLATSGAAAVLAAVGVAASLIPARRATRIDPKLALNAD
jgi:predicted permease